MTSPYHFAPTPHACDTCATVFSPEPGTVMYDAKTSSGSWACMCVHCQFFGPGLGRIGLGVGQRYVRRKDGLFWVTAGYK